MRPLALLVVLATAGAAAPAAAGPSVTLNGVNIDGVTGQKFENCTVTIDGKGDVHIEAKGYAVKSAATNGAATNGAGTNGASPDPSKVPVTTAATKPQDPRAPAGKVTRRYFLATEHTPPGTQYDLAIFINAQWIREVKASEPQLVMEITRYLRPGPNKVTLAATKRIQGERLAYGADVQLKVVIGEGNVGGGHVMIDLPLVETARTAAEIEDRTEEFVVDAR